MGRPGPRPKGCSLYMGRSARPMRRPICVDGAALTAAHDMWCIATITTTSTVPTRPPTCFDGRVRAVARELWFTTATTTTFAGVAGSFSAENSYICAMYFWQIAVGV